MQILNNHVSLPDNSSNVSDMLHPGDLLLDIETTGLSRAKHQIYLIGCASITDDKATNISQFFAEQPSEEEKILSEFSEFLSGTQINRIVTFNGNRFDLPFLAARAGDYDAPLSLAEYEPFDIYREVMKHRRLFNLKNYRQKTIEEFLGIQREDQYNGGELIKVYEQYVKTPDESYAHLLLLHNYEDVLGMADLFAIFSYEAFLQTTPEITAASIESYTDIDGKPAEELIVTLAPPCPLPGKLSCEHPLTGAYLHAQKETVHLRIPLYHRMARLYYLDYKNYFYLPAEDMAVHKSIAVSVDKAYREKATPENCYTRIPVTDEFLQSRQLAEYAGHVLKAFLSL